MTLRMSGHWSTGSSLMVAQVCFRKDPAGLEHMHWKIIVLPSYSLKTACLHPSNLEYTLTDIKITLLQTVVICPTAISKIHICLNIIIVSLPEKRHNKHSPPIENVLEEGPLWVHLVDSHTCSL